MTSIQDISVEILAIIFGFQPNWGLPVLGLFNTKFHRSVKLCSSEYEPPTYEKIAGVGWMAFGLKVAEETRSTLPLEFVDMSRSCLWRTS